MNVVNPCPVLWQCLDIVERAVPMERMFSLSHARISCEQTSSTHEMEVARASYLLDQAVRGLLPIAFDAAGLYGLAHGLRNTDWRGGEQMARERAWYAYSEASRAIFENGTGRRLEICREASLWTAFAAISIQFDDPRTAGRSFGRIAELVGEADPLAWSCVFDAIYHATYRVTLANGARR